MVLLGDFAPVGNGVGIRIEGYVTAIQYYVIVHAGFAIERLPERQALADLESWEELRDAF